MYMTATCFIIVTVFAGCSFFLTTLIQLCGPAMSHCTLLKFLGPNDFETKKLMVGNMIKCHYVSSRKLIGKHLISYLDLDVTVHHPHNS